MAKFLPFVNKDSPVHEIADKICSRYPNCSLATKLQLINILLSEGIEKVEKVVKELDENACTTETVVLREFSHVAPIPSNTLLVAKYFVAYVDELYPSGIYWNIDVCDDTVILCLASSLYTPLSCIPCGNTSIPELFRDEVHLNNLASKKLFSSFAAGVREFSCPEEIEAYLLLAQAEPRKMFETLDPEKQLIFTRPVRAVLKSEE